MLPESNGAKDNEKNNKNDTCIEKEKYDGLNIGDIT